MMHFASDASGAVTGLFEPLEIDLLRLVATQLVDLLEAADADAFGASVDPAMRRLLPDAYPDDPEAGAEFRRFTAGGLLERKLLNARAVLETLGSDEPEEANETNDEPDASGEPVTTEPATTEPVTTGSVTTEPVTIALGGAAIQSWLRTLTDLRLTLAERLEITPDGVPHLQGEEAEFLGDVYDWLGMVQESLVHAIDV